MSSTLSVEQLRAMTERTGAVAPAHSPQSDKSAGSVTTVMIRLRVLDVHPFEGNPRHTSNERIADIRESIRKIGLSSLVRVTQRSPGEQWITAAGGCSRVAALHQLATGYPASGVPEEQIKADKVRFEYADFIVQEYVSESDLLARHMTENLQRSDMSFWDIANGFVEMKKQLMLERGVGKMIPGDTCDALEQKGLKIDKPTLAIYEFAVCYYSAYQYKEQLTRDDIRNELRNGVLLLKGLWEKQQKKNFERLYEQWVFTVSLPQHSAADLHARVQVVAAKDYGYPPDKFASLLAAYKLDRDAPLEDLVARVTAATPAPTPKPVAASPVSPVSPVSPESAPEPAHAPAPTDLGTASAAPEAPTPPVVPAIQDSVPAFDFEAGAAVASLGDEAAASLGSRSEAAISTIEAAGAVIEEVEAERNELDSGDWDYGENSFYGVDVNKASFIPTNNDVSMQQSFDGQGDGFGRPVGEVGQVTGDLVDAQADFERALFDFAELGGVAGLVLEDHAMPYDFYIAEPQNGGLDELGVAAWWFLACVSGQLCAPGSAIEGDASSTSAVAATWSLLLNPAHSLSVAGFNLIQAMRRIS